MARFVRLLLTRPGRWRTGPWNLTGVRHGASAPSRQGRGARPHRYPGADRPKRRAVTPWRVRSSRSRSWSTAL